MSETALVVQMIPIDQINVLNPRNRSKVVFQSIVSNISSLGLKKPITVALRKEPVEGKRYDLVCGQGRLEAFMELGQKEIPAIVREASREECFLMSLVENIARRRHSPHELLREIISLKSRGYNSGQIAKKIDLTQGYVQGITHLMKHGEERLLSAVEKGRIPLSTAMQIACSDEAELQQVLCQAYEDKVLRGRKLIAVRRLIELRKTKGKGLHDTVRLKGDLPSSASALVRVYRQEADRQQLLIKRARLTQDRLLLIVTALGRLMEDENFVTLLRAEGLGTLPTYLAERIRGGEKCEGKNEQTGSDGV
jgi:ParB family transcriptional regulator, chromosome partitioning protein